VRSQLSRRVRAERAQGTLWRHGSQESRSSSGIGACDREAPGNMAVRRPLWHLRGADER
jgi:hypothetical protein